MESSTSMFIWSLVWFAPAIVGSIMGSDTAVIVGLVASTVNTVGSQLARLLENNKKENN